MPVPSMIPARPDEIVVIDGESVALTDTNSGTTGSNSYGYSVSLSGTTATVTLTTTGTSEGDAQTLVDGLGACHVVVGEDFVFGHGRRGTAKFLKEVADSHGFDVTVVPAASGPDGTVYSSTRIRHSLRGTNAIGSSVGLF